MYSGSSVPKNDSLRCFVFYLKFILITLKFTECSEFAGSAVRVCRVGRCLFVLVGNFLTRNKDQRKVDQHFHDVMIGSTCFAKVQGHRKVGGPLIVVTQPPVGYERLSALETGTLAG